MPNNRAIAEIRENGFVILPNLIGTDRLTAMREAFADLLKAERFGRNPFEGYRTERIYTLVSKAPCFAALVEHPAVLEIIDAFLEPNYLLSTAQAINIHPGEAAQSLHTDDSFYPGARPRDAFSISTIWALDDFTDDNGATEVIPGSHRWNDDTLNSLLYRTDFTTRPREERVRTGADLDDRTDLANRLQRVVMPAGSVIVFLGTLVHRGGANYSDRPRLAITNQYCASWARQQENFSLAVPPEKARTMSERVQQLLGYSIHPPFMGHVAGLHPKRLLEADSGVSSASSPGPTD